MDLYRIGVYRKMHRPLPPPAYPLGHRPLIIGVYGKSDRYLWLGVYHRWDRGLYIGVYGWGIDSYSAQRPLLFFDRGLYAPPLPVYCLRFHAHAAIRERVQEAMKQMHTHKQLRDENSRERFVLHLES